MAVAQPGQGSKRRALCRTGEKKESRINMHNPCLPLTASNHARDFSSIPSPTQVHFWTTASQKCRERDSRKFSFQNNQFDNRTISWHKPIYYLLICQHFSWHLLPILSLTIFSYLKFWKRNQVTVYSELFTFTPPTLLLNVDLRTYRPQHQWLFWKQNTKQKQTKPFLSSSSQG